VAGTASRDHYGTEAHAARDRDPDLCRAGRVGQADGSCAGRVGQDDREPPEPAVPQARRAQPGAGHRTGPRAGAARRLMRPDRPLRLLYVTARYPPHVGGTEVHTAEVATRLAARGHHVTVLAADATDGTQHER